MFAKMRFEALEILFTHPAPGFTCHACGDPHEKLGLVAPVSHHAFAPASSDDLAKIPSVPGSGDAIDFYTRHDGVLLYTARGAMADQGGPHEGIEIFPIREWATRTTETLDSWESVECNDDLPYGRGDFISCAHSQGAANYIHWVVKGPNAGKVYWWA